MQFGWTIRTAGRTRSTSGMLSAGAVIEMFLIVGGGWNA